MPPSRDEVALQQPLRHLDSHPSRDPDEHADAQNEESTLFGSDDIHSPLTDEEEDEDHAREVVQRRKLPWWKRPSPYWMIFGTPLGSIGYSATLAPKVDMYTTLACRVHRPDYISTNHAYSLTLQNTTFTHATDQPIPQVYDDGNIAVVDMTFVLPNLTDPRRTDYTSNTPNSQQRCASDPVVQSAVATLNAVLTTAMGVVACFTTGWWGTLSDRYGRRPIVWISLLGFLAADLVHVITALFVDVLPGGYWFLLVGYLVEGFCGGLPTGAAVNHAYLADTTEPSTRSRYFSLSLGLLFAGVGIGPILGGILIRLTGTTLSVFYLATVLHGLCALLILFVLPESLTKARARGARLRHEKQKADELHNSPALQIFKTATKFLSPLAILLPRRFSEEHLPHRSRRDWSLFLCAISFGLMTSVMGGFSYKFQYAAAYFHWSSEILSYYVAATGVARAAFLATILPFIIRYLEPAPIRLPFTPDEPLRGAIGVSASNDASQTPEHSRPTSREPYIRSSSNSSEFDLKLAIVSVCLETLSYFGMAIATTGSCFTAATLLGSTGAGFQPAVQALALEFYTSENPQRQGEAGKLFGALSVVQTLSSQIISPAIYGFIYSATVSTFPQGIMVASMTTGLLAFLSLLVVRVPSKLPGGTLIPGNEGFVDNEAAPDLLAAATEETFLDG